MTDLSNMIKSVEMNTLKLKTAWKKIDLTLQRMDEIYNANFYNWIQDPKNIKESWHQVARIINDYKEEQIIAGLTWLFREWNIKEISTFVELVFMKDISKHDFGVLCNRASLILKLIKDWKKQQKKEFFKLIVLNLTNNEIREFKRALVFFKKEGVKKIN